MSAKAVNEATGKNLLNKCIEGQAAVQCRFASVNKDTNWTALAQDNPWLNSEVSSNLFYKIVCFVLLGVILK